MRTFATAIVSAVTGILLLHASQQPQTGPATEKRFPPLKAPTGFKATLFACDPLIEYPSVIAAGPKPGALFVAFDYMTGLGTDGKVKSEIRLVEDTNNDGYADRATLVAGGFNSIQGLAYHDQTLFVMHAPFLTAVRIPSPPAPLPKGEGRKDVLSGLGLTPEQNPVRLHCANGVVVGHDGWLYLAMGDNGINVPRPEGDRLVHNGGCILRCRPDGRDLHIFSTGLRNIYDIALDAELNVFTRDNENDGGAYMVRVQHSFFGADHGYPYDYYERPDHCLKPIGDFGLGSSAGGVCYLETQFPAEYRGNLFFCEWGKSVVRYELKRRHFADSTFAPVKEIDFAEGDSKDTYPFKPTDVVVQRDGTLMVSDYADGQRPKRGRGRIYHIQYVGQAFQPDVKPRAMTAKLDSASYFDRCEAQAWVEREDHVPTWSELGARGKWHTIWALAHLDGPKALDRLFSILQKDPDASVRVQAVRAIADLADPVLVKHKFDAGRGDVQIAERLAELGKKQPMRVRQEIMLALGRLRWTGAPDWLRSHLLPADEPVRHAAMWMLRRADNWPAVLKLLDVRSEADYVRETALRALSDQHETMIVDDLIKRLDSDADPLSRSYIAPLLTRVYKKPGPWKYWGYRPGPRPANTEAWERTRAIEEALDRYLASADRAFILNYMAREKVPARLATLGKWLNGPKLAEDVALILTAMKNYPAADVRKHLEAVVRERTHEPSNRTIALEMILAEPGVDAPALLAGLSKNLDESPTLADILRRLGTYPKFEKAAAVIAPHLRFSHPIVRAAAMDSLGELRAVEARKFVMPFLEDKDVRVRRAAAGAAGKLGVKEAIEPLLKLATDPDVETRGNSLDSLRLLREPRVLKPALAALEVPSLELRALACIAELGGPGDAKVVAEFARRHLSTDAVALAARALVGWRDRDGTAESVKQDLNRAVAEIQGASGILAHWDVSVPYNAGGRDGIIKTMGVPPKRTRFWSPVFSTGAEGRITLTPLKDANQMLRYLLTDIDVTRETPVEFLASSKTAWEVFLNGNSLHRRARPGKFQLDADRFAATLQQGMNRILIDAGAPDADFEFQLRFRRKSSKAEHEALTQTALTRAGNAERGRKVFFDKDKSQCIKCHTLTTSSPSGRGEQTVGERIGPDLTDVGKRFSRIHIIESILDPSRNIAPSFGSYVVALKSGKTLSGVKLAETETMLTVADNQGMKHVLAKKDIDDVQLSPVSTMPDGLETRMTSDEFIDLIAFLASQKESSRP